MAEPLFHDTRKGAEDLFSKAAQDHIDVTAYTKPMVHLDELANTVGTSINLCVDQNLENALQYFKSILTNLNGTIDYAVALQEEARHCFDNVYSPASLAKATFCGKIGFAVQWNFAKAFPTDTSTNTELSIYFATSDPSFTVCTTTGEFSEMNQYHLSHLAATTTEPPDEQGGCDYS